MTSDSLLALRAARIHTLDPEQPEAECIVLRGGRVEATGSVDDALSRFGRSLEWLDLRPAVILPGLTDSHIHLVEWALGLAQPDLAGATSMEEVHLTDRQREVLALLVQGKSNKLICRELDLAEATVKIHVTAILRALRVTSRAQAIVAVNQLGLTPNSLLSKR